MSQILDNKGIIFSPDFINLDACLEILDKASEWFSAIKIGNMTLYEHGYKAIKLIKEYSGLPVICDYKLMEIPDVATKILAYGEENGINGAMIWGLAGEETLRSCITNFPNLMIFVVTEFTHTTGCDELKGDEIASLALKLGAFGVQAPATKPDRIMKLRGIVGTTLKIISCGVGYQGPSYGSAIKNGADFEIIGRSIYSAADPINEAREAYSMVQLSSKNI